MDPWVLGIVFAKLAALIIFGGICLSIRWLIFKLMPDCWLKRQLLAERFQSAASRSTRHHGGNPA